MVVREPRLLASAVRGRAMALRLSATDRERGPEGLLPPARRRSDALRRGGASVRFVPLRLQPVRPIGASPRARAFRRSFIRASHPHTRLTASPLEEIDHDRLRCRALLA